MANARVFISHSGTDADFCNQLAQALESAGADVFYMNGTTAHEGPLSGPLINTIQAELGNRANFIVLLSPAALNATFVKYECQLAVTLQLDHPDRCVVPITVAPLAAERFDQDWLFLRPFRRIERPGCQPWPADVAMQRILTSLGLPAPGLPPPEAQRLVQEGKALLDAQRYDDAVLPLEEARRLAPGWEMPWALCGFAYLGMSKSSSHTSLQQARANATRAAALLERAVRINPEVGPTWRALASALRAKAAALRSLGNNGEQAADADARAAAADAQADRLR